MKHIIEYWLSGRNGLWYFHVRDKQGNIFERSDGFSQKQHCLAAIHKDYDQSKVKELEPQRNTSTSITHLMLEMRGVPCARQI